MIEFNFGRRGSPPTGNCPRFHGRKNGDRDQSLDRQPPNPIQSTSLLPLQIEESMTPNSASPSLALPSPVNSTRQSGGFD